MKSSMCHSGDTVQPKMNNFFKDLKNFEVYIKILTFRAHHAKCWAE